MYRTLGNVITPSRFVKPYTKGIFLHGRRIFLKYKEKTFVFVLSIFPKASPEMVKEYPKDCGASILQGRKRKTQANGGE